MITFFTLVIIIGISGIWFFTKKKPNKQKKVISIIISIVAFLGFGLFTELSKEDKTNQQTESIADIHKESSVKKEEKTINTTVKKEEKKNDSTSDKFFEINKIKDNYEPGSQIIDIDHYNNFTEGVLTLEGVITKFGLPTNAVGAEEGDSNMEVIYPSNEDGNSIGLIFENKKTSYGDWLLKEKYVVETSGVTIPKYKK